MVFQFPIQPNTMEGRDLTPVQDLTELLRMGQTLWLLVNTYFASWYNFHVCQFSLKSVLLAGEHQGNTFKYNKLNLQAEPRNYSENLEESGMHRIWEYGNLPDWGERTQELGRGGKGKGWIKENQSSSSVQKATDSSCLYLSCAGYDQNANILLLSINFSVQMIVGLKVQSYINEA